MENTIIGQNSVIEEGAVIGKNCKIGCNTVIHKDVVLEENIIIGDNTILGKEPYKAANSATTSSEVFPPLTISKDSIIGASCVLYIGAFLGERGFVGDLATIREKTVIGNGTIIGKGSTIENGTKIGKKVKIETGAYITAFSIIEDYCFIAPEVTFTNDNYLGRTEERKKHFKGPTIKKGARIGANATILPGIEIGEDALVAAGSVVTKNLEPQKIYSGVPARFLKPVPEEQLLENQIFYEG